MIHRAQGVEKKNSRPERESNPGLRLNVRIRALNTFFVDKQQSRLERRCTNRGFRIKANTSHSENVNYLIVRSSVP